MIPPALLIALQTVPAEAPRVVEDDEIVWINGGEGRFWQEVLFDVTPTSVVQTALVTAFREVPAGTLVKAVEAGPDTAERVIGFAAYNRYRNQASDAGRPAVAAASVALAGFIGRWDARPLPATVSGRLRPHVLEANRQNRGLLPLWCATLKGSRDRMIDLFVKEPN